MKQLELENGVKLIYEKRLGSISSLCIGFNGGALEEEGFPFGTAHAVEHMVSKGTKNRSEFEINKLCDEIFGFENAMTNYPYVIYYGTTLNEDIKRGMELFSDILLNPAFSKEGFNEEIGVIYEELKEWKDDVYQYCEDELFFNAFNTRRIKNTIIGTEESIRSISLKNIEDFYNKYYCPENTVISVVTSLDFDKVVDMVNEYFGKWEKPFSEIKHSKYENNNEGLFTEIKKDISGAKIQYCYPIHMLDEKELKALKLFNYYFGEGTSCILYDEIRTKNGLAYEIYSSIKNERGIKVFNITMGTSKNNVEKSIKLIDKCIEKVKNNKHIFNKENIDKACKSIKLKRELRIEKSIQLAKDLVVYQLMYEPPYNLYSEIDELDLVSIDDINEVISKVFNCPTIQIITP